MTIQLHCFLCGQDYKPTEDATRKHTHHAGPAVELGRAMAPDQVLHALAVCQRERDELWRAIRGAGPAPSQMVAEPAPADLVTEVTSDDSRGSAAALRAFLVRQWWHFWP